MIEATRHKEPCIACAPCWSCFTSPSTLPRTRITSPSTDDVDSSSLVNTATHDAASVLQRSAHRFRPRRCQVDATRQLHILESSTHHSQPLPSFQLRTCVSSTLVIQLELKLTLSHSHVSSQAQCCRASLQSRVRQGPRSFPLCDKQGTSPAGWLYARRHVTNALASGRSLPLPVLRGESSAYQ